MTLDLKKPVRLKMGNAARIICDNRGGDLPLVVLVDLGSGYEESFYYAADGSTPLNDGYTLVNVPPAKKTVQVEVRLYRNEDDGRIHSGSWIVGSRFGPLRGEIASATITMEYTDEGVT